MPFVRAQVGVVLTQATASRPLAEAALNGPAEDRGADQVVVAVIGRVPVLPSCRGGSVNVQRRNRGQGPAWPMCSDSVSRPCR
ncbi:MAG: hypothetical protein P8124_08410 [Gammaproteobacteria bacterium]